MSNSDGRGHIYIIEPTGPFENNPNLTNKRFPKNPTRAYTPANP
ncbi:MAG: NAD(+)--rifampin ADP-ribosyltransferase [Nitrosomonas sp.]|nr:MAG: NAD(+)--rifampin ADP-ribosyltransferase [Nitrosomonas sp.]